MLHRAGRGVPRDLELAASWHEKAARQGLANAQYQLGLLYERGEGVAPDDAQAARWYRDAAAQGEIPAQARLGLMYLEGRGVPQDDVLAYAWLALAAEGGEDASLREQAAQARASLEERMSAAEIAASRAKMAELRKALGAPAF
jgi:TPR repeat protein